MKIASYIISSFLLSILICACDSPKEPASNNFENQIPVFSDDNMSGEALFSHQFTPNEGLGPHFNATSCTECHIAPSIGGVADDNSDIVLRIGFLSDGVFSDLSDENGPSIRAHSVADEGYLCDVSNSIDTNVNVVSLRATLSLFGLGIVDQIPDALIEAEAKDQGFGIHGSVNKIPMTSGGYRVGRFGWKAQKADLLLFTAEAFRNEIGTTNIFFPYDNFDPSTPGLNECAGYNQGIEISEKAIKKVNDFIASLPIKNAALPDLNSTGFAYFKEAKCHLCHKPSYEVENKKHFLFSDFLLHDMGDSLNDNFIQGNAKGMDWRTSPLHGLGFRTSYLHDVRTKSLDTAIRTHRGEGYQSMTLYSNFSQEKKDDLIDFLNSL